MKKLELIQAEGSIEESILKDLIELQKYNLADPANAMRFGSIAEDIGDDNNAGGYDYSVDEFNEFLFKYEIDGNAK